MDIQTAKTIPIHELLLKLNLQPTKQQGGRRWYYSPFRHENTPSFVLSKDSYAFFDHGEGKGGNILDLAMRLAPCSSVAQALAYLDALLGQQPYVHSQSRYHSPIHPPVAAAYQLLAVHPFWVRTSAGDYTQGASYLVSRGIDPGRAAHFIRYIRFAHQDGTQPLQGFGLLNQAGGYEVRARWSQHYIKTCVGPKDISFFSATLPEHQAASVQVFEGAPDFYTFLTIQSPLEATQQNFLILNGAGQVNKALLFLRPRSFERIQLWAHNDETGRQTINAFSAFSQQVVLMNALYEGFKDYNEWHMAQLSNPLRATISPPLSKLKRTPPLP